MLLSHGSQFINGQRESCHSSCPPTNTPVTVPENARKGGAHLRAPFFAPRSADNKGSAKRTRTLS